MLRTNPLVAGEPVAHAEQIQSLWLEQMQSAVLKWILTYNA